MMSILNKFSLATLNALSAHIAIVDSNGFIVAVNDQWRNFAYLNGGGSDVMENANYFTVCDNARGTDSHLANEFSTGLRAVLTGDDATYSLEYPCHGPSEKRWFMSNVSKLRANNEVYAVVSHENITERKIAQQLLFQQSKEKAIVEERQRISRELHDGVNQMLFASMSIAEGIPNILLKDPDRVSALLNDIVQLNRAATAEMRLLLSELRPELILDTPLSSLYKQLVDKLVPHIENSTISVFGEEIPTPTEVHFALYRIMQEAVNNVIKHSKATSVNLVMKYEDKQLTIQINDDGCGFNLQTIRKQVGLASMQERALEANLKLDITTALSEGTKITVIWVYPD